MIARLSLMAWNCSDREKSYNPFFQYAPACPVLYKFLRKRKHNEIIHCGVQERTCFFDARQPDKQTE